MIAATLIALSIFTVVLCCVRDAPLTVHCVDCGAFYQRPMGDQLRMHRDCPTPGAAARRTDTSINAHGA